MIGILTELLGLAQVGKLAGVVYVAQITGDRRHKFGALGLFDAEPHSGLGAVGRLWGQLLQMCG